MQRAHGCFPPGLHGCPAQFPSTLAIVNNHPTLSSSAECFIYHILELSFIWKATSDCTLHPLGTYIVRASFEFFEWCTLYPTLILCSLKQKQIKPTNYLSQSLCYMQKKSRLFEIAIVAFGNLASSLLLKLISATLTCTEQAAFVLNILPCDTPPSASRLRYPFLLARTLPCSVPKPCSKIASTTEPFQQLSPETVHLLLSSHGTLDSP